MFLRFPTKLQHSYYLALSVNLAVVACSMPDYRFQDSAGGATSLGGANTGGASNSDDGGGLGGTSPLRTDCTNDAECQLHTTNKMCNTGTSRCVECTSSTDCAVGLYCDPVEFSCRVGCNSNTDCGTARNCDASPCPSLTCNLTTHECAGCATNADCGAGTACDPATSACVPACAQTSDCPRNWLCCGSTCANPQSDGAHCGNCLTSCAQPQANVACSDGVCQIASCKAGFANCDGKWSSDCEIDIQTDSANCGACGHACAANQACLNGTCGDVSCSQPGYINCDNNPSGACKTNKLRDANNCGQCGNICGSANGTAVCSNGQCDVACNSGFANCDKLVANGCEVDLPSSLQNCGTCGALCAPANATGACASGNCSIQGCNSGFANCDALVSNGCETNLNADPSNCSGCGSHCAYANAAAGCTGGICVLGACATGFGNCDSAASNGCETNLNSDAAHCGTCSAVCAYTNASAVCKNGLCALSSCSLGFADCDVIASNGCEANLNSDVDNCGACGNKCPSTGGTPACTNGVCGYNNCAAGLATCPIGGSCGTHTASDVDNCGGCGTRCSYPNANASCLSSLCAMGSCAAGYGNCDDSTANGCEVNLKSDVDNCGACGIKCSFANAAAICVNGACVKEACSSGYADCDGLVANGCEVNLLSDSNNCNSCGSKCGSANAAPACHTGACLLTCDLHFLNCDGANSNGCEVDGLTDPNNCGACGHVCAYGCSNGECNTPCTGKCSSPVNFTLDGGTKCTFGSSAQSDCTSPALGVGAVCYQTTSALTGGGCYNFIGGRTLTMNGVAQTCTTTSTAWSIPLPATVNGGYCISIGAGAYAYASFNVW